MSVQVEIKKMHLRQLTDELRFTVSPILDSDPQFERYLTYVETGKTPPPSLQAYGVDRLILSAFSQSNEFNLMWENWCESFPDSSLATSVERFKLALLDVARLTVELIASSEEEMMNRYALGRERFKHLLRESNGDAWDLLEDAPFDLGVLLEETGICRNHSLQTVTLGPVGKRISALMKAAQQTNPPDLQATIDGGRKNLE